MVAPNLLSPTTITGKTAVLAITTSEANLLVNASDSNIAIKVNALNVVNNTNTAANLTVRIYNAATGGTAANLLKDFSVAGANRVQVITKDAPIWLEENRRIVVQAGTGAALEAVISYEEIT